MPTDICKLCLEKKPLRSSHFMPRAVYDYCYKGEHRPVKVGDGFILPTDRQTQDYLLCDDCEQTLSREGEAWVCDKLAEWEKMFPLYGLLTKRPPAFDEDGMQVYFTANNPDIEYEKLIHFAIAIFWKASVHSWLGRTKEPRIELGPYSEALRKWLHGESEFPKHVYLTVIMEQPEKAQISALDPYAAERKTETHRTYFLHVPGIFFMLSVGKDVDESTKWLCIQNNSGHPIAICDPLTNRFAMIMAGSLKMSRKTKAYLKMEEKIGRERGRKLS